MALSLCRLLSRWLFTGMVAACAAPAFGAPARVLVMAEAVGVSPWYAQFLETLRTSLRDRHPDLELDVETFSKAVWAPARDGDLPEWLAQKYAGRRYDIVLAGSSEFVRSVVLLRDRLWPKATVVVPVVNLAQQATLIGVPRLTGLTPNDAVQATLAEVFRLLPHTEQVAVIASTLDNDPLRPDWRRSLAILEDRARLIDLSGLPLEQLRERVRALPPRSAVYFAAPGTTVGRVSAPRDLLVELVALAPVPVFVDASTMLGTGAVGGAVTSPETLGLQVARQIEALLVGTPPERIGFEPMSPPRLRFDWRALQRWRIPAERLPAGAEVIDRPPALWEAYRGQVIVGALVVLVQTALIAALLIERRRRQRAELQARQHLGDLARLNRGAALGALSAALAHEINQPLGAILSNAETAELLLDRPGAPPREALRELLVAIREDDQRAAAVLQRLRAWIANAPGELQPVVLNPLVAEVARMLGTELRLRETELQLALAPSLPDVVADAVQVQQVVLNLVLNALDALQARPPRQRRIVVTTAAAGGGQVEVAVRDNGPGLGGVAPERLFEPFFTTKAEGLGVGLAISRSIIERHRGRLQASDLADGACFRFTLPVQPLAPLSRAA